MPTENEEQNTFRNRERIVCDVLSDLERDSAILGGGRYAPAVSLKGALTSALDEAPQGESEKGRMTLEEHDKRHHPNGFNPETDKCKFREGLTAQIMAEDDLINMPPKVGALSKNNGAEGKPMSAQWDAGSKERVQKVANVLRNLLKGVKVEISNVPYQGGGEDSRKSISGIYTGSAADYEKPSLHYVGSGEGAQVYGWGLYGSNRREVAERYKWNNLKGGLLLDGVRMSTWGNSPMTHLARVASGAPTLDNVRERLVAWVNDPSATPKGRAQYEKALQFFDENRNRLSVITGNLYEQTWFTNREPGDESHLLSWYEPVSEENLKRIDAVSGPYDLNPVEDIDKVVTDNGTKFYWSGRDIFAPNSKGEVTGEILYKLLADRFDSAKGASEFLARAGIDGMKYPVDSYGKTVKDGDKAGWNYVSFRDDNIRIDHKWVNGEQRFFISPEGKVVGEYNRKTNEITLYPGAQVSDVVHEFAHGLWQFAEQEADEGRGTLQRAIISIAEAAPQAVKDSVSRNYADQGPSVILEECFTHELARGSNEAFAKAIETDAGKPWYKKAWSAIKSIWKDFASYAGLNKAQIGNLDKMEPKEAARHILGEMARGKTFGMLQQKGIDGDERFSKSNPLSNKETKRISSMLAKKRPDLDADAIMGELAKIEDRALRGDAFFWITKGAIRLPEDMYKVEQARELASKAKKDPRQYATPQACINALQKSGHKLKEKPISVEELKKNPLMRDYRNEGYGVETFEVDDSRDGQTLMRKVIDTHWGEDANPWCLLARTHNTPEYYTDEFYDWVNEERAAGRVGYYDSIYTTVAERYEKETGKSALNQSVPNLDSAWDHWNTYNALPKRVAFKDGKLLAFMATDGRGPIAPEAMKHRQEYLESEDHKKYDMSFQNWLWNNYPDVNIVGEEWWDRNDEPHAGIPIGETDIEGDELGRKVDAMLVAGEVVPSKNANAFKKVDGNTYTWYGVSDQMFAEDMADGTRRKWDRDGDLMSEIHSDGTEIHYHNGHKALERWVDGTEKQYDEKGQLFSILYPDGRFKVME